MRRVIVTLLFVALLAFAGCSGKSKTSPTPTAATPTTTGAGTTTTPTLAAPTTTVVYTPPPSIVTFTPAPVTVTATPTPGPSSSSSGGGGGPAGTPPELSGVSASSTGSTSAQIRWTVDDDFDGVQSSGHYGAGTSLSQATPTKIGNGTFHVDVTGLASCTSYSYQVTAVDVGGLTAASSVGTFATPAGPAPAAANLTLVAAMHNSLSIQWNVTGPGDSVSYVNYGTTTAYGFATAGQTGAGTHYAVLSGLDASKAYHLKVHVTTPCAQADGPDTTFTTATLVGVDIIGTNPGPLTFAPAGGNPGPITVPKNTRLVFQVHNKDTTAHDFNIAGKSFGSAAIAPGATLVISPSISLSAASYTIYSTDNNPSGSGSLGAKYGTLNTQ